MRIKLLAVFSVMVVFISGCATVPSEPIVSQKVVETDGIQSDWLPALSAKLSRGIVGSDTKKIASLDFVDLQGRTTELGRYLAEQLSVEMVNEKGISVVDRANFKSILAEHKLSMEGLVDPENAKQLGKFAGIDAILTGTVTTLDDKIVLTVKAITTETAQIVAAAKATFKKTPELQQLSIRSISPAPGSAPATAPASPIRAAYSDPEAIATKDIGDLRVVLKNIHPVTAEDGSQKIQCVFEFVNINLKDTVLIANTLFGENLNYISFDQPKSLLIDSLGQTWKLNRLSGLSSIQGYGAKDGAQIIQRVMNGKYVVTEQGVPDCLYNQKCWSGGLTAITASQSARVTMLFSKYGMASVQRTNGKYWVNGEVADNKIPDSFQFESELILCGGSPEKPENCSSTTLMFDDISLPKNK